MNYMVDNYYYNIDSRSRFFLLRNIFFFNILINFYIKLLKIMDLKILKNYSIFFIIFIFQIIYKLKIEVLLDSSDSEEEEDEEGILDEVFIREFSIFRGLMV